MIVLSLHFMKGQGPCISDLTEMSSDTHTKYDVVIHSDEAPEKKKRSLARLLLYTLTHTNTLSESERLVQLYVSVFQSELTAVMDYRLDMILT